MFRCASRLASKFRLAKNTIDPVDSKWSRYYAANDIQNTGGPHINKIKHIPGPKDHDVLEESPLPCDGASFVQQLPKPKPTATVGGMKYVNIMLQAMYLEGRKAVREGAAIFDIEKGIDMAIEAVIKHLKCKARMISTFEEISQIGKIAATGNNKAGELVAKAIEKVGKDGFFIIDQVNAGNKLEFVNIMDLNWGLATTYFITDKKNEKCVLRNPFIFIYENIISNHSFVERVIESAGYVRHLLIVAEHFTEEVLGFIILHNTTREAKVFAVVPSVIEENNNVIMQDLATLTGGQVVTGLSGFNFTPQMLGSCAEVTVSCTKMRMFGGSGGRSDIEKRCEQLRSAINLSSSHNEVKLLEERLVRLSRCAAAFKVAGASKAATTKMGNGVYKALKSVMAAMEVGIVPGDGVALLHASKELDKLQDKLQITDSDMKFGFQLFQTALKMPVHTIASAAGFDGSVVVEKLLEQDNPDLGYDPVRGEYVDMINSQIFDPLESVTEELDKVRRAFFADCLSHAYAIWSERAH